MSFFVKDKSKFKNNNSIIKKKQNKGFYNTKLGKIFKDSKKNSGLKEQFFLMIYFEMIGAILCLLLFFVLSGGKNYIRLYKDLNKLINVYDTISSNYYGEVKQEELVDNAIEAMLESVGDGFTTYNDKDTTNDFLENIGGTYEGIGCTVSTNKDGYIYIVSIFEKSPSEEAGLKDGDIILSIDGIDYTNKTSEDMSQYIKNSNKKEFKLTIKRDEINKDLTIVRKKIEIPSVTSEIINEENPKIGILKVSVFSGVTYEQFKTELEKVEKQNIKGLIIDVRNDTGGYLSAVTDISSLFLKKGQIIYQLQDSKKTEKIKDNSKEYRKYPIAVLINGGSASASEILASAIKESYEYDSFIVGTNSYGKGTVQKTKQLSDGSMIKYTIQKWLTPQGNWINEVGVEPTNYVDFGNLNGIDKQTEVAKNLILDKLK